MARATIICPACGRGRVGYDGYTCKCGQRFRLPVRGRLHFFAEADRDALFRETDGRLLTVDHLVALPQLRGVDFEVTAFEIPEAWLSEAADLAESGGEKLPKWRGRPVS